MEVSIKNIEAEAEEVGENDAELEASDDSVEEI
jgi:hypothetical protein